ncbi:MAG TPA: hypothetical protein VJ301_13530 [Propionibacteriaceae bacterium]|nr:hypothetical protein [Propionibacteriaceae bacterium]
MSPQAAAAYIAALKAVVAAASSPDQPVERRPVDPVMTQRYLEACQARKRVPDEEANP